MGATQESLLNLADFQIEKLTIILNRLKSTKYSLSGLAEPCSDCKEDYPSSLEAKLVRISYLCDQIQAESSIISSTVWSNWIESACTSNCGPR